MSSWCLSAGSFRFLVPPVPTEEFGLPCGKLTSSIDHPLDLIGVTLFRMCEIQPGRMPSLLRGLGIHSCDSSAHRDQSPIHHRISRSDDRDVTQPHRRFMCIHPSDFPLARSPHSARPLPWTLPLAFHPTVTSDAERDWGQPWILGWERLCSTQHKRPQVALTKSSA